MLHPHLKELDFLAVGCVSGRTHQGGGSLKIVGKMYKKPCFKVYKYKFCQHVH